MIESNGRAESPNKFTTTTKECPSAELSHLVSMDNPTGKVKVTCIDNSSPSLALNKEAIAATTAPTKANRPTGVSVHIVTGHSLEVIDPLQCTWHSCSSGTKDRKVSCSIQT